MEVKVYETSAEGNQLTQISGFLTEEVQVEITLNPNEKFQTITGFGGSFTESSAYLLNNLGKEMYLKTKKLKQYFKQK